MASLGALPVYAAWVALLRLLVGRLAAPIAAAVLPDTRLLRAVAALPGGGRLISARFVLLPRPQILIGRLLRRVAVLGRRVAVLRHRVAILARGRLPAAARIVTRR